MGVTPNSNTEYTLTGRNQMNKDMDKLEQYNRQRQAVIEATKNLNVTMPIDQAAKLLPDKPEWAQYVAKPDKK